MSDVEPPTRGRTAGPITGLRTENHHLSLLVEQAVPVTSRDTTPSTRPGAGGNGG